MPPHPQPVGAELLVAPDLARVARAIDEHPAARRVLADLQPIRERAKLQETDGEPVDEPGPAGGGSAEPRRRRARRRWPPSSPSASARTASRTTFRRARSSGAGGPGGTVTPSASRNREVSRGSRRRSWPPAVRALTPGASGRQASRPCLVFATARSASSGRGAERDARVTRWTVQRAGFALAARRSGLTHLTR